MPKVIFILLMLVLKSGDAPSQNVATNFHWLQGEWHMVTSKGLIIEIWKDTTNGSLAGMSFFKNNNGDKKLLENILLSCLGDTCWYIPCVAGQNNGNAIKFKLTAVNSGKFVAENTDHDFPQRITYELINSDSLHAWIDDGKTVPAKKSDYYYKRKQ